MPSRSEGFGLSLIEAVIYKKPVVLSSIPIFRELFSSEEVSFFELSSIESFVEAVENVKKCAEKVDLAYNRFISTYSPEIFYKRYISIYER
jgi:glycosyltransferase involved in cell wall biosynthesis